MGARPVTFVTTLDRCGWPKMKFTLRLSTFNAYQLHADGKRGSSRLPRRQAERSILTIGRDVATAIVMCNLSAGGVFGEVLDQLRSCGRNPFIGFGGREAHEQHDRLPVGVPQNGLRADGSELRRFDFARGDGFIRSHFGSLAMSGETNIASAQQRVAGRPGW